MAETVNITVNGTQHSKEVEGRTLLVHFLRDTLGLTGTHVGCDTSSCGACTVHIDGKAVKSCSMLAAQADGKSITTIEGMANGDELHPLQESVYHRIETYVFSTSLQRISDELNESDFCTALQKVSDTVPHWAGGTDIGQSLRSFAQNDYQQLLDRKSIVLIISDGLDMGEPEVLEESLKVIKKRANKIVWLNPLAGHAGYKPEARSMKAALPLIDVFSLGHNFETLKEVILKLKV